MMREDVLRQVRTGDCCIINMGGVVAHYLVRQIGEWYLELEYLDKTPGYFDCRIGFRSIRSIEAY